MSSFNAKKLNIGSGQRPFATEAGWTNIDKVAHKGMPEPDVLCDGAKMPFDDDSAEIVVLHQVLEHEGCGEGAGLVRECHRVLHPGGRLIITVPDIRALAARWLAGKIDDYTFMVNVMGAYMGHEEDRHRWHMTKEGMGKFLKESAEWQWVGEFDFRPIEGADIAGPEWWILGMECVK